MKRLAKAKIEVPDTSIGSTPTISAARNLEGIGEVRPGNYAFFDVFQSAIGSCASRDVAFSVLATVVSVHPEEQRAVIDAGALALSKDPGPTHVDPDCGFGRIVAVEDQHPLPGLRLTSVSQEHGEIEGPRHRRPATRHPPPDPAQPQLSLSRVFRQLPRGPRHRDHRSLAAVSRVVS